MVKLENKHLTVISNDTCTPEDIRLRIKAIITALQASDNELMDAENRYFLLEVLADYQATENQWKIVVSK